jgi:hypothetical protein
MTVRLRYRKNLLGLSRDLDARVLRNRVYPKGVAVDGIHWTMGNARWEIIDRDVTAQTITIGPDLTGDPVRYADQLNRLGVQLVGSSTLFEITASTTAGVLTLRTFDPNTLVVGEFVHIRVIDPCAPNGWYQLTRLDRPASISTYGMVEATVERNDIPPIDVLNPDPFLQTWTGTPAVPSSWPYVDGVHQQITDERYRRYGPYSIYMDCTGTTHFGIESEWFPVYPSAEHPYFSAVISMMLITGDDVRMEIIADPIGTQSGAYSSGGVVFPDPSGALAEITRLNVWTDISIEGIDLWEIGAKQVKMRVMKRAGIGEDAIFYLDAAMFTQTPTKPPIFYDRIASNQLWHATNDELALFGEPQASYEVDIADRYRIDPATFEFDEIRKGVPATVFDPELLSGSVLTRVVDLRRDLRKTTAGVSRVVLSAKQEDLTRITGREAPISRPLIPNPVDPEIGAGTTGGALSNLAVELQIDPDSNGHDYHLLSWDHTQSIEAATGGPYAVDIYQIEDGGTPTLLASGRDPRFEYGGSNTEAYKGSFRVGVSPGVQGVDPYRQYVYQVVLKTGGVAGRTYLTSITGYYI